jgi:hypothetical protein
VKRLVLLFILIPVTAHAWTLFWNPVTKYVSGVDIEPTKVVTYAVRVDSVEQGAVPCNPGADGNCEWLIPDDLINLTGHNKRMVFDLQTRLDTGEVSNWSSPFAWTTPSGVPAPASGIGVRSGSPGTTVP